MKRIQISGPAQERSCIWTPIPSNDIGQLLLGMEVEPDDITALFNSDESYNVTWPKVLQNGSEYSAEWVFWAELSVEEIGEIDKSDIAEVNAITELLLPIDEDAFRKNSGHKCSNEKILYGLMSRTLHVNNYINGNIDYSKIETFVRENTQKPFIDSFGAVQIPISDTEVESLQFHLNHLSNDDMTFWVGCSKCDLSSNAFNNEQIDTYIDDLEIVNLLIRNIVDLFNHVNPNQIDLLVEKINEFIEMLDEDDYQNEFKLLRMQIKKLPEEIADEIQCD